MPVARSARKVLQGGESTGCQHIEGMGLIAKIIEKACVQLSLLKLGCIEYGFHVFDIGFNALYLALAQGVAQSGYGAFPIGFPTNYFGQHGVK